MPRNRVHKTMLYVLLATEFGAVAPNVEAIQAFYYYRDVDKWELELLGNADRYVVDETLAIGILGPDLVRDMKGVIYGKHIRPVAND